MWFGAKRRMAPATWCRNFFTMQTIFFHIDYLHRLIPLRSIVVLGKSGENINGVRIGMSAKSVLLTWGRIISFIAMVIAAIAAISMFNDPHEKDAPTAAIAAMALGGFYALLMILPRRKISYMRARKLGEMVKPQRAGVGGGADVMYGRRSARGYGNGRQIIEIEKLCITTKCTKRQKRSRRNSRFICPSS